MRKETQKRETYSVYLVLCGDGTLYTGYTSNPERRFREHKNGKCRYTRRKGAVGMRVVREFKSRKDAMRYERYLKRKSHGIKVELFKN